MHCVHTYLCVCLCCTSAASVSPWWLSRTVRNPSSASPAACRRPHSSKSQTEATQNSSSVDSKKEGVSYRGTHWLEQDGWLEQTPCMYACMHVRMYVYTYLQKLHSPKHRHHLLERDVGPLGTYVRTHRSKEVNHEELTPEELTALYVHPLKLSHSHSMHNDSLYCTHMTCILYMHILTT